MKTLIIYKSHHHMNTEKVAKAMAEAMNAKLANLRFAATKQSFVRLAKVEDVRPEELAGHDMIGFGPGIYGNKHHKSLFKLIEKMPVMDKKVFVFSTSGNLRDRHHNLIKEKLADKGCKIVGEFSCLGEVRPLGFNLNLKGSLGWIGGKNKGHPDEKDLENARTFAKGLLNV